MTRQNDNGESIGWIAICDVFLVGSLMMLAAAIALGGRLDESEGALIKTEHELAEQKRKREAVQQRQKDGEKELKSAAEEIRSKQEALEKTQKALEQAVRDLAKARRDLGDAPDPSDLSAAEEKVRRLNEQAVALRSELAALEAQLKNKQAVTQEQTRQIADYEKIKSALGEENVKLIQDLAAAQRDLRKVNRELTALLDGRERVHKELLDLKGRLGRVVFVYDRSGSMQTRWKHTRETVLTWLTHLAVEEFAVVAFGHDVSVFPPPLGRPDLTLNKGMLVLDKDARAANIGALRHWMETNIKPDGKFTDTLAGMATAYEEFENVDTIVLFTDGEPNTANARDGDKLADYRQRIISRCKRECTDHEIVVNVVALGNYHTKPEFTAFLMDIAERTQGTFIGR